MAQSGFSGGPERWRAEREPILEAIDRDGDILDVGCANGYLLQCLVLWAREKGRVLVPHGLDIGPRLIQLARARLPEYSSNVHLGNGWNWLPPRRYRYVYSLWDCVPESYFGEYCRRLLTRIVEPGGKLIVGVYGSRSRGIVPFDVGRRLGSLGFSVAGTTSGGDLPVSRFAWVNA
jgi:SAM-dependent methyltransferase